MLMIVSVLSILNWEKLRPERIKVLDWVSGDLLSIPGSIPDLLGNLELYLFASVSPYAK